MPAPFDLKSLLSNPEKLTFAAAGFDLQREFMTEAIVKYVPLHFDTKRAGRRLSSLLGPNYACGLRFVMAPGVRSGEEARMPLVVAFNRPMPVDDMLENLTKAIEVETRLCGENPDKNIRALTYYRQDVFNRMLAAGRIRKPDGP